MLPVCFAGKQIDCVYWLALLPSDHDVPVAIPNVSKVAQRVPELVQFLQLIE